MTKNEVLKGLKGLIGIARRNDEIRIASGAYFRELISEAYSLLNPEAADMEGGGSSWWYVCPECHGHIKYGTKFCPECGKEVLWK